MVGELLPVPRAGDVFADVRSGDRTMRVSWHAEAGDAGVVVVSLWAGRLCRASFRLPAADVPRLVAALTAVVAAGDAGTGTADTPVSPAA